MIVVKVEMWPGGVEERSRELVRMYIANEGTSGNPKRGNYLAAVMRRGEVRAPWKHGYKRNETANPIRTGHVKGHPRLSQHVLHLIRKCIEACFEGKPQETEDNSSA